MRVEPINEYLPSIFVVEPTPREPPENPFIAPTPSDGNPSSMANLLQNIQKIRRFYAQRRVRFRYDEAGSVHGGAKYEMYLQFPNQGIRDLALSIVAPGDSNDAKAYKILMWVQENIAYASDIETYRRPEHWTLPTMTLEESTGDCEDGAFLIHSLMLNAGIPHDRVRTYGGAVYAGPGALGGGHAWTAYLREVDNEWVALDWCYYPQDLTVAERLPLREDHKYFDDWFYVEATKTVDATYTNNLRGVFLNVLT